MMETFYQLKVDNIILVVFKLGAVIHITLLI